MKKSKADPRNPPIEDLQGQVYQHELGDPDRAEQIDRVLEEWERKASAKKRTRGKKEPSTRSQKTATTAGSLLTRKHLLIAVDISERALAYVAALADGRRDIRILLVHVPKPIPPKLLEFGGREDPGEEKRAESALRRARTDWIERAQLAAAPIFGHARAVLREAGVPEEVIDTQIVAWNPNESLDSAILEVAHEKTLRHCGRRLCSIFMVSGTSAPTFSGGPIAKSGWNSSLDCPLGISSRFKRFGKSCSQTREAT
jgi:nucleotide-binding universal stress UspA family protein